MKKKKEKIEIGELLGAIFEHKWLYRVSVLLMSLGCILLANIAHFYYTKELEVFGVASYYQFFTLSFDFFFIVSVLGTLYFIYLKYCYTHGLKS